MKVSVIVPVYNTEKYLLKCINSLLGQTLQELEIVAVNDGSTDGCRELLDNLQSENPDKIKLIHKENGGQATARNLALKYCSGEYVGFLDSDDYVLPEMFSTMYNKAKETNADYVACGYMDTASVNGKNVILKNYVASRVANNNKDLFLGALVSPFLHLYRRELLLDNDIKFPEGVIYEDTAFYLNAIPYIHKIAVVEKPLAVRVRHSNSTMTITRREKVAQIFEVLRYSIDYYKSNGFYEEYQKELEYFCTRILLCSSMERISRVACSRDRRQLTSQTLSFIFKYFPKYRKNPYLKKGMVHLYMKSFCRVTAFFYLFLFHIKSKIGRRYE